MSSTVSALPVPRGKNIAAWVLQALLAFVYAGAAAAKLAGAAAMVDIFAQIGVGQWFRSVTGIVELVGVIALLVPGFAAAGGLWLGVTMVCAIVAHVAILHTSPVPPLVLLALNLLVVWLRGYQLPALRQRFFG